MPNKPAPLHPPAEWFTPPKGMKPDTHIHVDDNGRVYGYVTHWGRCLLDGSNECWTPESSPSNYSLAHQGDTVVEDGSTIKTANIGGGEGHAPAMSGVSGVARWYQDTSTQLMRVRYGDDDEGIWFAGSLWPDVSELEIARLRASALSGDWRWIGDESRYDFLGSCCVNVPGLPLYRAASLGVDGSPRTVFGGYAMCDNNCDGCGCGKKKRAEVMIASASTVDTVTLADGEVAFESVLLVEGEPTSDGRLIEKGATTWRELPLSLLLQDTTAAGHDGAFVIGRIDRIWRDGDTIRAAGMITTKDDKRKYAIELMKDKSLRGVSIDGAAGEDDVSFDEESGQLTFHRIEILAATVTPTPAHAKGEITIDDGETDMSDEETHEFDQAEAWASVLDEIKELKAEVSVLTAFSMNQSIDALVGEFSE